MGRTRAEVIERGKVLMNDVSFLVIQANQIRSWQESRQPEEESTAAPEEAAAQTQMPVRAAQEARPLEASVGILGDEYSKTTTGWMGRRATQGWKNTARDACGKRNSHMEG